MNIEIPTGWRRWLWPLFTRKVQVAVASALVAYFAAAGLDIDRQVQAVLTVLGIVVPAAAVIFGIAIEDASAKR